MGNIGSGVFEVARIFYPENSDGLRYETVRGDYDTLEEAMRAISVISREENIPESELVVLRPYFTHDEEYRTFMRLEPDSKEL